MKLRIVIGALLIALIAELLWLTAALDRDQAAAIKNTQQQEFALWQKGNEVAALQSDLDNLEAEVFGDLNEELQHLKEEIAMLSGQEEDVSGEIAALSAELEELKIKYDELKVENEYFLEVYNELEEGLEKVKGYLAGD